MSAAQKIIEFIQERNVDNPDFKIDLDTDLFETGYLDSMGYVGLTVLVEELSGSEVDFEKTKPEDLRTIRQVLDRFFPERAAEPQ